MKEKWRTVEASIFKLSRNLIMIPFSGMLLHLKPRLRRKKDVTMVSKKLVFLGSVMKSTDTSLSYRSLHQGSRATVRMKLKLGKVRVSHAAMQQYPVAMQGRISGHSGSVNTVDGTTQSLPGAASTEMAQHLDQSTESNSPEQSTGGGDLDSKHCQNAFSSCKTLQEECIDESDLFKCVVCSRSCSTQENLQDHAKLHAGEQYPCLLCSKSFTSKFSLRTHLVSQHVAQYSVKCSSCLETFPSHSQLEKHVCTKQQMSTEWSEKGVVEVQLDDHLTIKGPVYSHDKENVQDGCEHSVSASRETSTQVHDNMPENCRLSLSTPNDVEVVGKPLQHQTPDLETHSGKSVERKSYLYTDCSKIDERTGADVVLQEEPANNGTKPPTCTVCLKVFRELRTLKAHMRFHTGYRPHKCHLCQKKFFRTDGLQTHLKQNNAKKPLRCPECHINFSLCSQLKAHVKEFHPEKYHSGYELQEAVGIKRVARKAEGKQIGSIKQSSNEDKSCTGRSRREVTIAGVDPSRMYDTSKNISSSTNQQGNNAEKPLGNSSGESLFGSQSKEPTADAHHEECESQHSNSKQHKPDACTSFSRLSSDKPFICHMCHRQFETDNALQVHLKLNYSKELLKCTLCNSSSSMCFVLKQHVEEDHGLNFESEYCHLQKGRLIVLVNKLKLQNSEAHAEMSALAKAADDDHDTNKGKESIATHNEESDVDMDNSDTPCADILTYRDSSPQTQLAQGNMSECFAQREIQIIKSSTEGFSENDEAYTRASRLDRTESFYAEQSEEIYSDSCTVGAAVSSNTDTLFQGPHVLGSASESLLQQQSESTKFCDSGSREPEPNQSGNENRKCRKESCDSVICQVMGKPIEDQSPELETQRGKFTKDTSHTNSSQKQKITGADAALQKEQAKNSENYPRCTFCLKVFRDQRNLKAHMRFHTGYRPHKCHLCQKKFFHSRGLQSHLQKNSAKKPLECPECPEDFSLCSQLKAHVQKYHPEMYHSGYELQEAIKSRRVAKTAEVQQSQGEEISSKPQTKDFPIAGKVSPRCGICHKVFREQRNLNMHMRFHTNYRPFKCRLCHARFTHCSYFRKHSKKNNASRPLMCFKCHQTFSVCSEQKAHLKMIHGLDYDAQYDRYFSVKLGTTNVDTGDGVAGCAPVREQHSSMCNQTSQHTNHSARVRQSPHQHQDKHGKGRSQRTMNYVEVDRSPMCDMSAKNILSKANQNKNSVDKRLGKSPEKVSLCPQSRESMADTRQAKYRSQQDGKSSRRHSDVSFQCHMCHQQFETDNALDMHLSQNYGSEPLKCILCDWNASMCFTIKEHVEENHGLNYVSEYCQLSKSMPVVLLKRLEFPRGQDHADISASPNAANDNDTSNESGSVIQPPIQFSLAEMGVRTDNADGEYTQVLSGIGTSLDNMLDQENPGDCHPHHEIQITKPRRDTDVDNDCHESEGPLQHQVQGVVSTCPEPSEEMDYSGTEDACVSTDMDTSFQQPPVQGSKSENRSQQNEITKFRNTVFSEPEPYRSGNKSSNSRKECSDSVVHQVMGKPLEHQSSDYNTQRGKSTKDRSHTEGRKQQKIANADAAHQEERPKNSEYNPSCNICLKVFSNQTNLKAHMRYHTGYRPHECHICQKRFSHSGGLRRHLGHNNAKKPLKCPVCAEDFSLCSQLKAHVKEIHPEMYHSRYELQEAVGIWKDARRAEVQLFEVQESPSKTQNKGLRDDDMSPRCGICKKVFREQRYLMAHMRYHTGYRPHKCRICQKRFFHSSGLQSHMKENNAKQPLKCPECPEDFSLCSQLKAHVKKCHPEMYHSGYELQEDKYTSQQDRQSSRRHNSDVSFQCHMCHQQFETDDRLDMHLRKTYGSVPFKCILCDWNAARCLRLKKHAEEDHGLDYESEYCQLSKSRSIDQQKSPAYPSREIHADVSALAKAASEYYTSNEIESTLQHQNQSSLAELGVQTNNSDRDYGQDLSRTPNLPENDPVQGSPRECIPPHGNYITKDRRATDVDHDGPQSEGPLQHQVQVMSSEPSETMDYSGTEDTCVSTGVDTSFQEPPVQGSKSEARSQQNEITQFHNTVFSKPELYQSGNKNSKCRKDSSDSVVHQVMGKLLEHQSPDNETQRDKSTKDTSSTECRKKQKTGSADAVHQNERAKTRANYPRCNVCLKVFRNQRNLMLHMRFHTGYRPHECHLCQKKFFRNDSLQKHLEKNNAKKPLECPECPEDFSLCSQLRAHVKKCHPETYHSGYELQEAVGILRYAKRAECQQSEVEESPSRTQNKGLQVDDNMLPRCGICKKTFREQKNLTAHMRYHTGYRPHKCLLCQKRFFHSSGLRRHLKNNNAKKPLECLECLQDFSLCSQLKAHVKKCHPEMYHSGYEIQEAVGIWRDAKRAEVQWSEVEERPSKTQNKDLHIDEVSPKCSKHLDRSPEKESVALVHQDKCRSQQDRQSSRRHNSDVPFQCHMCHQQFETDDALDMHLRQNYGSEPLKCILCDWNASMCFTIKEHVEENHGLNYVSEYCQLSKSTPVVLVNRLEFPRGQDHADISASPNAANDNDTSNESGSAIQPPIQFSLAEMGVCTDNADGEYTQVLSGIGTSLDNGLDQENPGDCLPHHEIQITKPRRDTDVDNDCHESEGPLQHQVQVMVSSRPELSEEMDYSGTEYACVSTDVDTSFQKHQSPDSETQRDKSTKDTSHDSDCSKKLKIPSVDEEDKYRSQQDRQSSRRHNSDVPFQCHMCHQQFETDDALDIHLRKTYGNVPFKCILCDWKASRCFKLKKHMEEDHGLNYESEYWQLSKSRTMYPLKRPVFPSRESHADVSALAEAASECNEIESMLQHQSQSSPAELGVQTDNSGREYGQVLASTPNLPENGPAQGSPGECIPQHGNHITKTRRATDDDDGGHQSEGLLQHQVQVMVSSRPELSEEMDYSGTEYACVSTDVDTSFQKHQSPDSETQRDKSTKDTSHDSDCSKKQKIPSADAGHRNERAKNSANNPKCNFCHKVFRDRTTLRAHMRFHTGYRPHKCHLCQKRFFHSGGLQKHLKKNNAKTPLSCPECLEQFSLCSQLKAHVQTCHPEMYHSGYELQVAVGITRDAKNADVQRSEVAESPLETQNKGLKVDDNMLPRCGICKKTFREQKNLTAHMRYHTGYRPRKCHLCQKRFFHSRGLQKHLKQNNAKKPLACPECPEIFSLCSQLKVHVQNCHPEMYHSGYELQEAVGIWRAAKKAEVEESPSKTQNKGLQVNDNMLPRCGICKKVYLHQRSLMAHMRYHTGYRPHKCRLCQKKFFQSKDLQLHLRKNNAENPLECPKCPKDFSLCSQLKAHVQTCHPEMYHSGYEQQVAAGIWRNAKCAEVQQSGVEESPLERHGYDCDAQYDRHISCNLRSTNVNIKKDVAGHAPEIEQHNSICSHIDDNVNQIESIGQSQPQNEDNSCKGRLQKNVTFARVDQSQTCSSFPKVHSNTNHKKEKATEQNDKTSEKLALCVQLMESMSNIHHGEGKYEHDNGNDERRRQCGDMPFECHMCHQRFKTDGALDLHLKQNFGIGSWKCKLCDWSSSMCFAVKKHEKEEHGLNYESEYCQLSEGRQMFLANSLEALTGEDCAEMTDVQIIESESSYQQPNQSLLQELEVGIDNLDKGYAHILTSTDALLQNGPAEGSAGEYLPQHGIQITEARVGVDVDHDGHSSEGLLQYKLQVNESSGAQPREEMNCFDTEDPGTRGHYKDCEDGANHNDMTKGGEIGPATSHKQNVRAKDLKQKCIPKEPHSPSNPLCSISCDLCHKVFCSKHVLKEHMKLHMGEKNYECQLCKEQFFQSCYLQKHLQKNYADKLLHCPKCVSDFPVCSELKKHIEDEHTECWEPANNSIVHNKSSARKVTARGVSSSQRQNLQGSPAESSDSECRNSIPPSCVLCNAIFHNEQALKEHIIGHASKEILHCVFCSEEFPSEESLQEHSVQNKAGGVKCGKCCETFSNCALLQEHVENSHGKIIYEIPSTRRSKAVTIQPHDKPHGEMTHDSVHSTEQEAHVAQWQQGHDCEVCLKVFEHFSDLQQHMESHYDDESLTGLQFLGTQMESKTMMYCDSEGKRYYQCSLCHKVCKTGHGLKNHINSHKKSQEEEQTPKESKSKKTRKQRDKKPVSCPICETTFPHRSALRVHTVLHFKPFKCGICKRAFTHKAFLQLHMKRHLRLRDAMCDICSKMFYSSAEVAKHKRYVHPAPEDVDKYKCPHCPRTFSRIDNFKSHMECHDKNRERLFVCHVCGSKLYTSSSLKSHLRTHTRERAFKCQVCDKSFIEKKHLTNHARLHTGETPWKCDICQMGFAQQAGLYWHKKRNKCETGD